MTARRSDTIRDKVHAGERLSFDDGLYLDREADLFLLGELANLVRERKNGNITYYNVNQHLNPTNVCVYRCKFCSFRADLKGDNAYVMSDGQILHRAEEATRGGATELHIVGGLHHKLPYEWYRDNVIGAIHAHYPGLHLKAWTAVEWDWFERLTGRPTKELLADMRSVGLGSLPGGGAEIFHPEIRSQICDYKADGEQWLRVHREWHELGGKSNCTMLYGHIEQAEHRIDHMVKLRDLQDATGGFQTFIPLAFHPENNVLGEGKQKPGGLMDLRMIAVGRLMLDNIPHIKAYWQMLGIEIAQIAQSYGADDIDGTVVHEKIYHAAGSTSPQEQTVAQLRARIEEAGRVPVERDTLYREVVRTAPVEAQWETGRKLVSLA
jgi:aminodeoxyfutalosine synthase